MLIAALVLLGGALLAGMALGTKVLMLEQQPGGFTWRGLGHGVAGAAGVAALTMALRQPASPHAVKMGAGGFALVAATLLAAALAAGLLIVIAHLRRRKLAAPLVATHGVLAIVGYTLLATYLTLVR